MFQEDLFLKVVTGHKVETRRTGGLNQINTDPDGYRFTEMLQNPEVIRMYDGEPMCGKDDMPLIKTLKGTFAEFEGFFGDFDTTVVRPRYQPGEILFLKEPVGRINGHLFRAYDYPPTSKMRTEFKGWANKMFMRADDARHFIKITDVRCERAWEITEEGAIREGVANRAEFEKKWAEINGISSWKPNPYVFVYGFEYLPNYKI